MNLASIIIVAFGVIFIVVGPIAAHHFEIAARNEDTIGTAGKAKKEN